MCEWTLYSVMTESVVFITTCISTLCDAVLAVSADQIAVYPTNRMMSPEVNSKVYSQPFTGSGQSTRYNYKTDSDKQISES